MARAVELASRGPEHGPNPRVGCVLIGANGHVAGEGFHLGAGTPHAEVAAIEDARARGMELAGATAYVTLEPCTHTGRTGPCVDALSAAGVAAVRYAVDDPNPDAAGGGEVLRSRGVDAQYAPSVAAHELNRRWLLAVARRRPYVIAKWAATLDGRTAASDGSSFWITGEAAREHAHAVRAGVDAIVVGTGTVAMDDPWLSARPGGREDGHQPLRVVVGNRSTPGARVWRDDNAIELRTHDVGVVLAALHERECRVVLIEGGSVVTTAFLHADVVDEIHAYVAPMVLGAGTSAVGDLGIRTMADALRGQNLATTSLGEDVLIVARLEKGL